jgi:hypothetical protein
MLFVKVRLEETMKLFEFEEPRDLVELSHSKPGADHNSL